MSNYEIFLAGQNFGAWLRSDKEIHDGEIRAFAEEICCDYNLLTSSEENKSLDIILESISDNIQSSWFLVGFNTFYMCNGKIEGNIDGVLLQYRKKLEEAGVLVNDRDRIESLLAQLLKKDTLEERYVYISKVYELFREISIKESGASVVAKNPNRVFIVHGHDDSAKNNVARFVERLGLEAVILHEQPNQGRTIIEKFEAHASLSCFAITLLTPDDIGFACKRENEAKPRARQNVIFELGYFCRALGRKNVCVLYKEGIEIPNDYLGVVYTQMDDGDAWQLHLAKEMKHAGLPFDMNKAFG